MCKYAWHCNRPLLGNGSILFLHKKKEGKTPQMGYITCMHVGYYKSSFGPSQLHAVIFAATGILVCIWNSELTHPFEHREK